MQVSQKQLIEYLKELDANVEIVEDDNPDFDGEALSSSIKEYFTPDIKMSVSKDIESDLHGSWINSFRTLAQRKLSIPIKDLKDKKMDEMMEIIKSNVSATGDKEAQDWKAKYEQLVSDSNTQAEEIENNWKNKYDTDIAAANKKYIDRDINDGFVKLTEAIPRTGGNLIEQADALRYKVEKAGYEVKIGNDGLEFWKDNRKHKLNEVIDPIAANIFPKANSTAHIKPSDVKAGKVETPAGIEQKQFPAGDKLSGIMEWANATP